MIESFNFQSMLTTLLVQPAHFDLMTLYPFNYMVLLYVAVVSKYWGGGANFKLKDESTAPTPCSRGFGIST